MKVGALAASSLHREKLAGHTWLVSAQAPAAAITQLRIAMDEPYRTLLGHFRHEIGHSYFHRLVGSSPEHLAQFAELFGQPRH